VLKKAELTLRKMLKNYGYSEKVADELWKWCDFSEKKGVASF
jgi:hypothetical protein